MIVTTDWMGWGVEQMLEEITTMFILQKDHEEPFSSEDPVIGSIC